MTDQSKSSIPESCVMHINKFSPLKCDTRHVHYSTGHLRPLVQAHLTSTTCCFPCMLTLSPNLFIGKGFIDLNRPQPFHLPWTACGSPRGSADSRALTQHVVPIWGPGESPPTWITNAYHCVLCWQVDFKLDFMCC